MYRLILNYASLVQVLSGPLDSSRVMKTYLEPNNDSTYTNVFAGADYCGYFGITGLKVGDEFLFNFGSPYDLLNPRPLCYGCMISGPLPLVMEDVKDVQKLQ